LHGNASLKCASQGRLGVGWVFVRVKQQADDDLFTGLVQMHGGFQAVATIVAGASGHPNAPCVWRHSQCKLGCRSTCLDHQWGFAVRLQLSLKGP
jgi:hypothetical protein